MPRSIPPHDTLPDPKWLMPDELWEKVQPLIPPMLEKGKTTRGGRPNADLRRTMNAIFYVLRTGCQWKAIPRCLGSGSTAHDYFQKWNEAGVFERLWRLGLKEYDALKGIQGRWQAMDGIMTKAPLAARRLGRIRRTEPRRGRNGRC